MSLLRLPDIVYDFFSGYRDEVVMGYQLSFARFLF